MSDGSGGPDGYVAVKHGAVGMTRTCANVLAPQSIRVNMIHEDFGAWSHTTKIADRMVNPMPVPALDPTDVSNTVAFLVSDDAKYITGVALPVDAGFNVRL